MGRYANVAVYARPTMLLFFLPWCVQKGIKIAQSISDDRRVESRHGGC